MENTYRILNLLENTGIISKKYDDIARLTGENFNVFSVMNMEWDEVKTHSAIIGELINPKGKHGQGDVFLNLFINQLNKKFSKIDESFQIESFQELVNGKICERNISPVDLINGTGGRIDIILEDKNQIIIIENKPGNKDQELQLIRYSNYAKTRNKPFKVFYLTTDGRNLNEIETHTLNELEIKGFNFHYSKRLEFDQCQINNDSLLKEHKCLYYPISFHTDIRDWLEKCHKESIEQPVLRETIKQYLNLIKKITNQTINESMREDLMNIMSRNTKESFEISNNIWNLKGKIYHNFMKLIKQYAEQNDMVVNEINLEADKEYGLYLKPNSWKENFFNICVIFESSNYRGFYYGVSYIEGITDIDKTNMREKFKKNIFEESDWWIWRYSVNKDWTDNGLIWEDIAKGADSNTYMEITNGILEILKIEKS